MKKRLGFIALLLAVLTCIAPAVSAQEEPATPEPATPDEPTDPVAEGEGERHFGLYLSFALGSGGADELNTSIAADNITRGVGFFEIDEALQSRAAVGWQLPEGKGDFRVAFTGFKEESYKYEADGLLNRVASGTEVNVDCAEGGGKVEDCLVSWWRLDAEDGTLTASLVPPQWEPNDVDMNNVCIPGTGDDLNCDGIPSVGEVRYDTANPETVVTSQIADNFDNQIHALDLMYGREFGGRRYSSRWFGGVRYFAYEGQLIAGAWLTPPSASEPGAGFTDGGFLKLIRLTQETTGFGPMGSWEVDFNFLDKGIQLYLKGMASFTFNSMEVDSGPIFQVVEDDELLEDRLIKDLDKSTWQNQGEVGVRINLQNGLSFEAAYSISGFLDVVITPDLMQIGVTNEDPQTATQDLVIDAFHVGASFQF